MSNLPTGTVTFLFTDIEGSTRLAQRYPDAMPALLARHNEILNHAIEAHNGFVFQIVGDSFSAAFHNASDALNASLDAQRLLHHEAWSPAPIKVRMGINTGTAQISSGDDFSSGYKGYTAMARVQRLMSAAHGGQVLISLATEELVRDELPEGASLRDMGEKRLKDLIRPEHIYQLLIPNLPADFPPLKTLDVYRHNLPIQLTSFIGREKEIEQIAQSIREHRLVTLTGSGGTGKTRLSLQVAADLTEQFADGVWFVELAPVSDPELIPQIILSTFGISEQQGRTVLQSLTDYSREKNLLLVLDNCEHLVEASAQFADTFLRACPKLKILASSREALGIAGETSYRVPSLSVPDPKHLPPIETLSQYDAVHLFIDRAVMVQSSFAITNQNAPALAQICYRLDGIPLALELAASRVNVLKVEDLEKRLDDRFRLLTGGSRTELPRHQTLRALIDWSCDLLSDPERALMRRLSVFAGGWTLSAAEAICAGAGIETFEVLELLSKLVDKSLVSADDQGGPFRYRMLETVRQYGSEKLIEQGERERLRGRHLGYFLRLVDEVAPMLRSGQREIWVQRLEQEQDNVRAAMAWAFKMNRLEGLQMAGALFWPWYFLGNFSEGREWVEQALELSDRLPKDQSAQLAQLTMRARASALHGGGQFAFFLGDYISANGRLEASVALWRQLDDKRGLAESLMHLGNLRMYQGDHTAALRLHRECVQLLRQTDAKWNLAYALFLMGDALAIQDDTEARKLYEESLALFRGIGDKWSIALPLTSLGHLAAEKSNYAAARTLLEESLTLRRAVGDRFMTAISLNALAEVLRYQGELAAGTLLSEESLKLNQALGQKSGISWSLRNLGDLARAQSDYRRAGMFFREALSLSHDLGQKREIASTLEALAQITAVQESSARAARLLGAADGLRQAVGVETLHPKERVEHDNQIVALRAQLGEQRFSEAWAEGRALTMEQAVELALEATHE